VELISAVVCSFLSLESLSFSLGSMLCVKGLFPLTFFPSLAFETLLSSWRGNQEFTPKTQLIPARRAKPPGKVNYQRGPQGVFSVFCF